MTEVRALIERNRGALERLANVDGVNFVESRWRRRPGRAAPPASMSRVVYERKIDVAAERERLEQRTCQADGRVGARTAQLSERSFLAKAPAQVVEGLKRRKGEVEMLVEKSQEAALDELEL